MDRLRKFLELPIADRLLLLQASFFLALVAVLLRILPFPSVRRLLLGRGPDEAGAPPEQVIKRIVWSVRTASRYVPAASCLPQAIVTRLMLRQRGYAATLRIGVTMDSRQRLMAHAWVERDGRILIGGVDSYRRYTALPPLEKEST